MDVRDAAWVHVEALLNPKAAGKRYLLSGGRLDYASAVGIIASSFPALKPKLAKIEQGSEDSGQPPYQVTSSAVEEDFGIDFIPLTKTITDWAAQVDQLLA